MSYIRSLVYIFCLVMMQGQSTVQAATGQQALRNQFEPLFDAVSEQLSNNQALYLHNPVAYSDFLAREVKARWDSDSTAGALVGRSQFKLLQPVERQALVAAVDKTLERYAYEGLEHYSGQSFKVTDVVVSKTGNMGWVQVLMKSPLIPDISLDLLVKQGITGGWKAVDIRFKGVTYVAIKKHQYRDILSQQGIGALIDYLNNKNTDFFAAVCAKVSPQLRGKSPC